MGPNTASGEATFPLRGVNESKLRTQLEMRIPCEVKAIDTVVNRVKGILEVGCELKNEFEVDLALREALANAVIHGCEEDKGKTVQLYIACDQSDEITIVVRDPGNGFDPDSVPSPVLGRNIYFSHGRGIFLIRKVMDEVHFARGGTEIRMRKK